MIERDDWRDLAPLVFLQTALVLLEITVVMLITLAVLYIAIYLMRSRRRSVKMNRCAICGHKVKFVSDCCRAPMKATGARGLCSKCKNLCEVACFGCRHKKCQKNCDKCVRYI